MVTPEMVKEWLAKPARFGYETGYRVATLELIQQLEAQVPKWISVEDRLPETDDPVLCWYLSGDGKYYHTTGFYVPRYDLWGTECDANDCGYGCKKVTHWMPLPEPPKEAPHE